MKEKIVEILNNAMEHYLNEVLAKTIPEKQDLIKNMFWIHMERIANYCLENYINVLELSEEFIKWLHKSFYPEWYKIDTIISWKRVLMIPGEYKTEDNRVDSVLEKWKVNKFCDAKHTAKEMQKLIENFNKDIKSFENKKDLIFWFSLDLSNIHPFWDGNGRLSVILADLLLLKNWLEPVNMHYYKEKDYYGLRRAGELTIKNRDLKYIYDFIEKTGGII
jgi:Fic family protein